MSLARQTELLQNLLQEIQGVIDTLEVTFHNAAITAADGTVQGVGAYNTLRVDIDGSPTSFTVAFKGIGPGGVSRALAAVNMETLETATTTSTSATSWLIPITGLTSVFMGITAITPGAGSLTVKGRMVA
jgi:hypothetical protein